ncbi:unnamed protein product, partial [marine sediment metagenome]
SVLVRTIFCSCVDFIPQVGQYFALGSTISPQLVHAVN